jgi:regulator of MON1-CCZ1 complex
MSLFHAHCYLQPDPITFEPEGQVFYDDPNQFLICYRNGIFSVISLSRKNIEPQSVDFIRRAPVLSVRFSLDRQYVCIQRSHTDIEITNLQNRSEATISCKSKDQGNMVHGCVWINSELCDIALITTQGLELMKIASDGSDLKLVKHDKRLIQWFIYNHTARLLCLCTGKDHNTIQCFQLLPDKLLKMPDFEPDAGIGPNGKRQPLKRNSFLTCRLYDKLCCIQICAPRQELVVYQLGKEAVGRLCTINLFTACEQFAVSVIDSLLVVHNTDSNITMVFDVWLQQWNSHPIVAPLPLGGPPLSTDAAAGGASTGGVSGGGADQSYGSATEVVEDWTFVHPSHVLDKQVRPPLPPQHPPHPPPPPPAPTLSVRAGPALQQ